MARGGPSEATYTPEVQAEDLPRKVVPEMSGASVGPAITRFADVLQNKYQADSATWAGDALAKARLKAVTGLDDAKANLPSGQDPGDFAGNFVKKFQQDNQPLMQSVAGNGIAKQMVTKGLGDLQDTLFEQAKHFESQQRVAYRSDSIETNLATQLSLVESNPKLAVQVGSTLADQVRSLGVEPSKQYSILREMHSRLSLAAANGMTRDDPRGMLSALNAPDQAPDDLKGVLSGLTDAQREAVRAKANGHLADGVYTALQSGDLRGAQLNLNKNEDLMDPKTADQVQKAINGQQMMNLTLADKQQRDSSNALLKNALLMSMEGKLTPQWIEQHHATWEPQAYEYAYKLLSGKEAQTDARTYAPLLQRALGGEDITSDANDALYGGRLSLSDYKGLLEKTDTSVRGSFVKQGASYIEQALKPSPMLFKPDAALDYANALADFQGWVKDNPKATPDQGMQMARTISQNYALVQANKATMFGSVPLHLVGSRTQPDLAATWAATKQAHQQGEMSDAEFNRQALLIQQWQEAQHVKTPPKAKP